MSVKERVFLDTNILVYSRDLSAGNKQIVAEELVRSLWKSRCGIISVQVLNEYFITVTRKLKPGLSAHQAWQDLSLLQAWQPLPLDWRLMQQAFLLYEKNSLSWWDAMIVAAAQSADCQMLYSEDLQHGCQYGSVKIRNPFRQ